MRTSYLSFLATLGLLCGCGSVAGPEIKPAMNLQIELKLLPEQVISGASLPVRTTVRNVGPNSVEVPKPKTLSPIGFTATDAEGRVIASGSAASALSGTGIPAPAAPQQTLAPKEEITYDDDVADHFNVPIPPGKYQLEGKILLEGQLAGSGRTPITVLPLVPEAAICASDQGCTSLMTLVVHKHDNNIRTVFFSKAYDRDGSRGVLKPALKFNGPVDSIALAPQAITETGTWVAALDRDGIRGRLAEPFGMAPAFGPVKLRGGEKLLETGIPLPDGGVMFVAAGQNGGRQVLTLVRISSMGATNVESISLANAPARLPVLAVSLEAGMPRAYVCWVDGDTVSVASFDPASPPVEITPMQVYRTKGPVVAHRAVPPAKGAPAQLDMISGPVREEAVPSFTRLTLGAPDKPLITPLPPLPNGAAVRNASLWMLPIAGGSPTGPLLVSIGAATWLLVDGAWQSPAAPIRAGHGTQLVRLGSRLWLSTWSPQSGLALEVLTQ